jgi:NAD(P)-dependent dehydrogenase (short-subunit alcohol dehydrogenase family)
MIEHTVAHFGGLDVLVNNAGMSMWSAFQDISDFSLFERLLRVNYLGSVYCTRYALPHLRQSCGQIVAVASVAGLTGVPTRTAYAASKHAMFGFFDSLRIELLGSGVAVTLIAPDFVASDIRQRGLAGDGQPLRKNPLQNEKIMTAEQCAALIVRAMTKRQRLLITSWRGWLGRWLKLIAPGLVDRVALAAIGRGR